MNHDAWLTAKWLKARGWSWIAKTKQHAALWLHTTGEYAPNMHAAQAAEWRRERMARKAGV